MAQWQRRVTGRGIHYLFFSLSCFGKWAKQGVKFNHSTHNVLKIERKVENEVS